MLDLSHLRRDRSEEIQRVGVVRLPVQDRPTTGLGAAEVAGAMLLGRCLDQRADGDAARDRRDSQSTAPRRNGRHVTSPRGS